MRQIILIIVIGVLASCIPNKNKDKLVFATELSEKTKQVVEDLIDYGEITGPVIGEAASRSKQWDNFQDLKNIATDEELLVLIEHSHPVVKCYAFDAMVSKRNPGIFDVIKEHLKDTSTVFTQFGCIRSPIQVNDYLIESISRPNPDRLYLSIDDKKMLDSLLLFTPNLKSDYRDQWIENLEPKEMYYLRLRELALKGNYSAIVSLSKYQKISDIKTVNSLLRSSDTNTQYHGLKAAKNFPNQKSFEFIKNIHAIEIKKSTRFDYAMLRVLYKAIVCYKNLESRQLLEKTISETQGLTKRYHSEFIWFALKECPDEIYNGIEEQLQLSDSQIVDLEYEWNWQQEINTLSARAN